jgi:hypothetical protein
MSFGWLKRSRVMKIREKFGLRDAAQPIVSLAELGEMR